MLHLPLDQPFNMPPWSYSGTESVAAIPNADIVDWVLVEIRDTTDASLATSASIVEQQAAFLLKDGSIVGMDGGSGISITQTPAYSFYLVIWHRNLLGVMSSAALTEASGIYTYDFTTGPGQAYGGINGHKEITPGIWGMVAADGNGDRQVNNTDKNAVWSGQAGSAGYLAGDFNMDSQVNNNDKNDLWIPNSGSGGQVPDGVMNGFECQAPK